MKKAKPYLFGVVGLFLVASVAMNVYQYVSEHQLGYTSHTVVHTMHVPDSIAWNGKTYWTDGEINPALANLKWLGVGKAGSKEINVFEVVGMSSQKEIVYIMGGAENMASART